MDVVDWSRTKQVTLSKLAQHTHPCTCTYTQRAQPDLSAWPMCAISKEVFRSYQSSMNTDSEENLRGEWVKQIFHLCAQEYFVLWTVEDTPSGTEWRVKEETTPATFQFTHAYRSTKTCIQRGRHPNAWIHNQKLVTVFKFICSWIW